MPRKKSSKNTSKEPKFKFNIKKIVKERKEYAELCKKSDAVTTTRVTTEQEKALDDMMKLEFKKIFGKDYNENSLVSPKFDFVVDSSKYNIPFDENSYSDINTACSQRLLIMSIEQCELQTNIHYNHLMNVKWSPELNDVRSVLHEWKIDLDTINCEPLPKHKIIILNKQFGRHNFEFVLNFIIQSILRDNTFSYNDLLTLAEFAIAIYFDHGCRHMNNVTKELFSNCIEKALHDSNEPDIIKYAQELYSKYEAHLVKLIRDLFFSPESQIMRKIYTYLTFKLFKSLTGKDDSIIYCPSKNEWFIQDLVDRDYFGQNPVKILKSIIKLLEHVVITFDLYSDEKKMSDMYDFLRIMINPSRSVISRFPKLLYILNQWKMHLFRLHLENIEKIYTKSYSNLK